MDRRPLAYRVPFTRTGVWIPPREPSTPASACENHVISRDWIRHTACTIMRSMRVSALILLVAAAVVLGSALPAAAEKVKTNQPTKVYAGPGEQKKVLLKVKPGQNMTLLEQEGRWLKVRVQGRTGYVPRSKVDMADDGEIARNTRRRPFVDGRSRKRGFGGEAGPDDRVGADATGGND